MGPESRRVLEARAQYLNSQMEIDRLQKEVLTLRETLEDREHMIRELNREALELKEQIAKTYVCLCREMHACIHAVYADMHMCMQACPRETYTCACRCTHMERHACMYADMPSWMWHF